MIIVFKNKFKNKKKGIKGQRCDRIFDQEDDACESKPCWNGGICTAFNDSNDGSKKFKCKCNAGYSGANCRTITGWKEKHLFFILV